MTADALTLTVGPTLDGRLVAVISIDGHPQRPGSGVCKVLTFELVTNIPNGDVDAWFERQKIERPWESRQ